MWRPQLIILQPTPYCNINCQYCYLHNRHDRRIMSHEVVDAICEKLLANVSSDAAPAIVWHAGEPTVVPLEWYRRQSIGQNAHQQMAGQMRRCILPEDHAPACSQGTDIQFTQLRDFGSKRQVIRRRRTDLDGRHEFTFAVWQIVI